MATYSYSIPNTLLFLQLINISFLTSIFFFILSFFQSKKKKIISIPGASEIIFTMVRNKRDFP